MIAVDRYRRRRYICILQPFSATVKSAGGGDDLRRTPRRRRLIADPQQLRIEYHSASDGVAAQTPDDSVTIDLATHKGTTYTPNDLGLPAAARAVRSLYEGQGG